MNDLGSDLGLKVPVPPGGGALATCASGHRGHGTWGRGMEMECRGEAGVPKKDFTDKGRLQSQREILV